MLCVQCHANSRCLTCTPYRRPTARDEEINRLVRVVRDRPEIGLLTGALGALIPAMLAWADLTFAAPGLLRILGAVTGAVAGGSCLAVGATFSKMPLPGEIPACKLNDRTPVDRWERIGVGALLVQLALVTIAIAAN